ncbi:hypothetical protein IID62_06315 [candidate division KSB1 bacterium]|nr:hypothetical protein [candidate division KSB1 bacterium]
MVSDIVLQGDLPDEVRNSAAAYAGCISGAIQESEYLEIIETAGFTDVKVVKSTQQVSIGKESGLKPGAMSNKSTVETVADNADSKNAGQASTSSITVSARKPN